MGDLERVKWESFTWVHTTYLPIYGWRSLWPVRAFYRLLNRLRD